MKIRWNVYPEPVGTKPIKVDATCPFNAILRAAEAFNKRPQDFRSVEEDVYYNVHGKSREED